MLLKINRTIMRRLIILCVYCTIYFVESTRYTNSSFVAGPSFNGLVSEEDKLGSVQCASPILCCAICKGNSSCLSAFYNNDNKTCTLYGKVFKATETRSISEVGSNYYHYTSTAEETNSTKELDVATTSKTLQTTAVSSPTGQVNKSYNLTDQNIDRYSEIRPSTFEIASEECTRKCTVDDCHLVWIDSEEENEEVGRKVEGSQYKDESFFTGHVFEGDEIDLFSSSLFTVPIFEGQFLYRNSSLKCIAIQASGNWTSVDCQVERPAVCENIKRSRQRRWRRG